VYLNAKLSKYGIYSFAPHPGAVLSEGAAPMLDALPEHVLSQHKGSFKSIDQGSSTSLVAAFDPNLTPEDGVFLADCQIAMPASWAVNEVYARRLWQLSEELTGDRFIL
jgi:hypothetical protein